MVKIVLLEAELEFVDWESASEAWQQSLSY